MPKPKSNSTLDGLPPHQKKQLIRWLVEENADYDVVVGRLQNDFSVESSRSAVQRFYTRRCFASVASEAKEFADSVETTLLAAGSDFDKATMALIKQKAFEQAKARGGDLKDLQILAGIIGDSNMLAFKERQLALSREKFIAELKDDIDKGLDALHAEIKGDATALQLFSQFRARISEIVGAKKS